MKIQDRGESVPREELAEYVPPGVLTAVEMLERSGWTYTGYYYRIVENTAWVSLHHQSETDFNGEPLCLEFTFAPTRAWWLREEKA